MGHSHGYRSGTRHSFSRQFRKKGPIALNRYLKSTKVGDYVDVVADPAVQKGMPHKTYHGRTGIIYNVTRRAVGVEINKQIRNRIEKKRINVRIEHVRPSKCRKDFLDRVQRNETIKREAKASGKPAPIEAIKRFPRGPKAGYTVAAHPKGGEAPVVVNALPFDEMI